MHGGIDQREQNRLRRLRDEREPAGPGVQVGALALQAFALAALGDVRATEHPIAALEFDKRSDAAVADHEVRGIVAERVRLQHRGPKLAQFEHDGFVVGVLVAGGATAVAAHRTSRER
jgi:hypothetical protein